MAVLYRKWEEYKLLFLNDAHVELLSAAAGGFWRANFANCTMWTRAGRAPAPPESSGSSRAPGADSRACPAGATSSVHLPRRARLPWRHTAVGLITGVRTVTAITLPRAKRPKRWKTGCARVQLTTLYPSLSLRQPGPVPARSPVRRVGLLLGRLLPPFGPAVAVEPGRLDGVIAGLLFQGRDAASRIRWRRRCSRPSGCCCW